MGKLGDSQVLISALSVLLRSQGFEKLLTELKATLEKVDGKLYWLEICEIFPCVSN